MNKNTILASLTPEIVASFREAIEIGKWADGRKLTAEQRQTCLQAVMVWEHEHLPPEERIGYIHKPVKNDGSVVGEACDVEHEHHYPNLPNPKGDVQPINFKS